MVGALDVFVDATKKINSLDIPSKEMADKLVRSAMRLVALDLADNNIVGAIETKNKYESIEHWFRRQHATLIVQNKVAVGRIEIIRQIGAHVRDKYEHAPYNAKSSLAPNERLKDLPIAPNTYLKWMDAADIAEDELREFIAPYLDEKVKDDIDGIFLGTILARFYPNKYSDVDAPNLQPHLKKVWLLGRDFMDAVSDMVIGCGSGDTPADQVTKVFEQMDKVTTSIKEAKRYIRDLYQGANYGNRG